MIAPETAPAKGVRFALQAFGCSPRAARLRAARIRYGRVLLEIDDTEREWTDAEKRTLRRHELAGRIIAERIP